LRRINIALPYPSFLRPDLVAPRIRANSRFRETPRRRSRRQLNETLQQQKLAFAVSAGNLQRTVQPSRVGLNCIA
jgi:hypothetical protein